MSSTPFRHRVALGPTLVVAMVLAALAPALIASYLLSANSYTSIETLAENAMSQAAHRVDVGALAHLGESHTVVNALVPPFNATGSEGERTRHWFKDAHSFETMAYALTQQSANVPYLYIGSADGSFLGVEREDQGFVVRQIRPGDTGRKHYLINNPGDRQNLIKTETTVFDPRKRPWYQLAASTGQRVFTDVYRSAVKNQYDLTLAQPIYEADGKTLMGVMAVDMSLARLTDLIRSTRISENAVTYLVDGQGRMVASSVDEDLSVMVQQKSQRITPMQSIEPLVRDSYAQLSARRSKVAPDAGGMIQLKGQDDWWQRLGLGDTNRLMALQRPFGSKYHLDWQLIVVAPEQDFTQHVISARQWALASIALLIGLSALIAYGVARGLSRQFRQLNASALAVGAGELPEVQHGAPFKEVYTLSEVMHNSAAKLRLSNAEIERKNLALQEAAQLLEARVRLRTSELASSREEALAAVRAKAGFLAVMSHEIRTPLHGVVGMSELLSESSQDPTQQELLGVLKVSSDQLLAVVDDILDFSKIESGHLLLEEEALNVRATLGSAVDIMRVMANEKGLHLSLQVAPDVPQAIKGDAVRLRQIVLNLLSNAIKFTSQGEVALRVWQAMSEDQHTLWFSVADSGIGISQQKLPELFKPFAQGDTATARVYGGTGLGLMICKHLVELMGGQISVESAPGTGSTFRFGIRCQPVAASAVVPAAEYGPPHESHVQRVLVVDDNPVNLKVASAMLSRLGYPHESVTTGELALKAITGAHQNHRPFSIVLLDSHMPVMDGQMTAEAIKTHWGTLAPVMIGISASTLGEDRQRCLAAGMSDYLPKPLELKRLADTLVHWCQPVAGAVTAPAARPTGNPDPRWIDPERWQELGECDDAAHSLRKDMVQDFLTSLPQRLEAIEKSCATRDWAGLVSSAHALKGSADNLGAQNLARTCAALEREAPEDSNLPVRMQGLREAAQGTRQALAGYLSS